ncbi:MAG: hypothetical protein ACI89L_002865 [Phycisphaerales bacterium]|jgi:hypothetical protein
MNKPLALVIAAALPAALLGGCSHHSWNSTTYYNAVLVPIDPPAGETDLNLYTEFGDLDVAITGTQINGKAFKHYQGELPDGPFVIAITQSNDPLRPATATVEPVWSGSELSLVTNWPGGRNGRNGEGTSYTVRVHHLYAATLDSQFGDLDIVGATGPVTAETKFGDIDLHAALASEARLITKHGDVSVWDLEGPLFARTSFGDVEGTHLAGPIEARSAYGDIDLLLNADNAGPFIAITRFGDVTVTAGHGLTGSLEIDTDFGEAIFTGQTASGQRIRVGGNDQSSVTLSDGPKSLAETDHGDVRVVITEGQ